MAIKVVIPMRLPDVNDYIDACRANRYSGANFKRQVENDCIKCHHKEEAINKSPCIECMTGNDCKFEPEGGRTE